MYPASCAFLAMLAQMINYDDVGILPSTRTITPLIRFVTDSILLKFAHRSYKNIAEMVSDC